MYLLVDRSLDSLSLRSQTLSLLPAHLLQHLETDVLAGDLELLVIWYIRFSAFLQRLQTQQTIWYIRFSTFLQRLQTQQTIWYIRFSTFLQRLQTQQTIWYIRFSTFLQRLQTQQTIWYIRFSTFLQRLQTQQTIWYIRFSTFLQRLQTQQTIWYIRFSTFLQRLQTQQTIWYIRFSAFLQRLQTQQAWHFTRSSRIGLIYLGSLTLNENIVKDAFTTNQFKLYNISGHKQYHWTLDRCLPPLNAIWNLTLFWRGQNKMTHPSSFALSLNRPLKW